MICSKDIGRYTPGEELSTLSDYRARFALYRTDQGLINAHLAAPWITVWDDHEVADNSWKVRVDLTSIILQSLTSDLVCRVVRLTPTILGQLAATSVLLMFASRNGKRRLLELITSGYLSGR